MPAPVVLCLNDTSASAIPACPLCGADAPQPFFADRRRPYLRCTLCRLIFVPGEYHLAPTQEKAEYDLHRNAVDDPGYRRFLDRLFTPLCQHLPAGARGLDFGCGPGPALARMFAEAGFAVDLYDPFYAPDPSVFQRCYGFITASEVVEHLAQPGWELARLWSMIAPGGWLGVMTKLARDREAFSRWHYKNDPTHISFFSRDTFVWLGQQWGATPLFVGADVVLVRKPLTCPANLTNAQS